MFKVSDEASKIPDRIKGKKRNAPNVDENLTNSYKP